MLLKDLLEGVRVIKLYSGMYGKMVLTQDVSVKNVRYDSRRVQHGDMFVALRGTAVDGHRFIDDAINSGAVVVVVDDDAARPDSLFMHVGVLKVLVADTRVALARIAANFHGQPAERLKVIGVTGTNGKTTTTHLLKAMLEATGEKVGLIGTIGYTIGDQIVPATHTTPESLELNELLSAIVQAHCSAAVLEVSSHALAMHRVEGIPFSAGVFTNLTQDHLDFHGTMEEYCRAKKILFDSLATGAFAVVNVDDPVGRRMVETTRAHILTYGTGEGADVQGSDIELSVHGSRCLVRQSGLTTEIRSPLTGRFNISNILAAFATGVALGLPEVTIAQGIGTVGVVRGRFEQIVAPSGWTAVVDYAHTPDALENCLRTIRDIMPQGQRIITVFGCGGDRDRGKRPIMGRIASAMSDVTIVTSDNPRSEDPTAIIQEIVLGTVRGKEVYTDADRRSAIRTALRAAHRGDVVLIAGKGHELYQLVGAVKHHFDDREEVEAFIRENG